MPTTRRIFGSSTFALVLSSLVLIMPLAAKAQDYPSKPIKIVVAFGPGGGSDTLARMLGQKMAETFKQPVVIENRPGAGGSIGTREVQKAAPDGYTLILATSSTHGINPWVIKNVGYDAIKDFTHIAVFANTDYALAVPANSPYKTLQELVAASKTKPIDYASSGNGSTSHLAGALLGQMTKANLVPCPTKVAIPPARTCWAARWHSCLTTPPSFCHLLKAGRSACWRRQGQAALRQPKIFRPLPKLAYPATRSWAGLP